MRRGRTRLLIVGNGMATDRLLDELDKRGALRELAVTVVGEECTGAYNRILLSHVLAGLDPDAVVTKPPGWYEEAGVTLVAGRWVQRLDLGARVAHVGDGQTVAYDMAVLATGSRPFLPPVSGLAAADGTRTAGVHVFRSLEDCLALRRELSPFAGRREVVVVGGGLLGLEAARAARDLGHRVSVLHPVEHLLNAQLDETGGRLLRTGIEADGISVVVGMAEAVLNGTAPAGSPRAEALLLDDGRVLAADTVVFTVGVRPRVEVAVASGIEVERGVVVDDTMATSAAGVFAIGECVQYEETTFGLVASCWDHAAVLADQLAGTGDHVRYVPAPVYARLKVAGFDVTSMGDVEARDGDEVVEVLERSRGVYRKLVVRGGRVAGAVLVGDSAAGPMLIGMLERGELLPTNRLDVFCSTDALGRASPIEGALCNCNRVTRDQVLEAITAGADTVEQVGRTTRAGTGCGSCVSSIERLLAHEAVVAA